MHRSYRRLLLRRGFKQGINVLNMASFVKIHRSFLGKTQLQERIGLYMNLSETISYCVDSAVKIAAETYGKTLDFSEESMDIVDTILDGYHERYLYQEKDGSLIRDHINSYASIFGIYVGEVLLRQYGKGYVWKETEYGVALAQDEKNMINPVAKAYKHIQNGKENGDDIKSFYRVAVSIMCGAFL